MAKRGWPRRTAPRRVQRRDQHAGIDGNDAGLVGEHWIEIEFAHLGQVGGKLRQLDHEKRDGVVVGGRDVAVSLEDAGDPRASDQARARARGPAAAAPGPCR